jgi:hypothetical protein
MAAIAVQGRFVGPQISRGAVALQRLLRPPQGKHDVGAVRVSLDGGGIERNRAIETGERFIGMPLDDQGLAQIDVGGRNLAIDGDGLPDQRDTVPGPALLEPHHAKHVHGVEMPGLPTEDFAVDALGGIEIALPMQRHSFPEARLQPASVLFHRTGYFVSN